MITQERIRYLFTYDPIDGSFVRRKRTANMSKVGEKAGSVNSKGYIVMKVDGKAYKAHRLAWLWWHGEWPKDQIDHINGDKQDNRIDNLRVVSNSENCQNKIKPYKNSKIARGVRYDERPGRVKRYESRLTVNGVRIFLGSFNTVEEAYEAYISAKMRLHIRGVL